MPLFAAVQVTLISTFEMAVPVTLAGGDGSASVVADTTADIGETFPSVSTAFTPKIEQHDCRVAAGARLVFPTAIQVIEGLFAIASNNDLVGKVVFLNGRQSKLHVFEIGR